MNILTPVLSPIIQNAFFQANGHSMRISAQAQVDLITQWIISERPK